MDSITENRVFRFVEDPHGYFLGDEELPSPSSVFRDLGLVNPAWYTEESSQRGRAVHAGIFYALKGTLDWDTLHADLHGYVKSGLLLVDYLKPTFLRFETPLYHPILKFAGTLDIEWNLDGCHWIPDWKSGKAPKVARYQTAAYEMLARLQSPKVKRWKRAAVELQSDGSIAKLVKYDDPSDLPAWVNLLGAYRIRQDLKASKIASHGE